MLLLLPILILIFIKIRGWGMRKVTDNTGERRGKRELTEQTAWSPGVLPQNLNSGHVNNCYLWGYRDPDPHYPSERLNITSIGCETMKTFPWHSWQSCSLRTESHCWSHKAQPDFCRVWQAQDLYKMTACYLPLKFLFVIQMRLQASLHCVLSI